MKLLVDASEAIDGDALEPIDAVGIDAAAEPVTDDEPAVTINDALLVFAPDRVVVVKHGTGDQAYREEVAQDSDAPLEVFFASSSA